MPLKYPVSIAATVAFGGAAALFAAACNMSGAASGASVTAPVAATGENAPTVAAAPVETKKAAASKLLTGKDAFGDWTTDAPGVRRKITVADLPKPFDTPSARNGPKVVPQPDGALPKVPEGFKVEQMVKNLGGPRVLTVAPNGDIFVAESYAGRVRVLRDADGDGKPEINQTFATELNRPFGIAFYPANTNKPTHVYIANTDSVVRFAYSPGLLTASGKPEMVVDSIPSGSEQVGGGGHWTRDIAFSRDSKKMFVSVGSRSNVTDDERENRRAMILEFTPDGQNEKQFATGIRNPVGLAIQPGTGDIWTSVNERDELGDHLVPDYITRVKPGGFYGWPWYYLGPNQDPRHTGKRLDLKGKVITPDVLLQSHSASLDLDFYTGKSFPKDYQNSIFAAEHGSWNRTRRTGYKVVRVPLNGKNATGEYEDFLTGFVTPSGDVWGRPVGIATARDGALLVSDDATGSIWRVSYVGAGK